MSRARGWVSLLMAGLGLAALPQARADQFVYLARIAAPAERARQLLSSAAAPNNWIRGDFDDSAWTPFPPPPVVPLAAAAPPVAAPPVNAGSLWATPAPPPSAGAPISSPDGGLIFVDESPSDGGTGRRGPLASAVELPEPPPAPLCSGNLYVRRRFDLGPEATRLSSLTLRLRYLDGF